MSPCWGQGEEGVRGGCCLSRGCWGGKFPWETQPWASSCSPSHGPRGRDVTSVTAKPSTGCWSSAWLLQGEDGEAHRGPPVSPSPASLLLPRGGKKTRFRLGFLFFFPNRGHELRPPPPPSSPGRKRCRVR